MKIPFNAEEILEMALTIEKNGAALYREAAQMTQDPDTRRFFEHLVAMEEEHERSFRDLRNRCIQADNREPLFDPDQEASRILEAWANGFVFDVREGAEKPLTGKESIEEILRIAVQAEKESAVFYLGLRDALIDPADAGLIDTIIGEEMAHLTELNVIFQRIKRG